MIDKTKEAPARIALKLALKVLDTTGTDYGSKQWEYENEAITAIREALAIGASEESSGAEQPAQPGCTRCNTPKKCALYGCSPLTWPAEQPAIPTVITCPFCTSEHVPGWLHDYNMDRDTHGEQPAPVLYTSPPTLSLAQRQALRADTWVGLTQQDIDIAFDDTREGGGFDDFARAIEAKLKAKNSP